MTSVSVGIVALPTLMVTNRNSVSKTAWITRLPTQAMARTDAGGAVVSPCGTGTTRITPAGSLPEAGEFRDGPSLSFIPMVRGTLVWAVVIAGFVATLVSAGSDRLGNSTSLGN